MDDKTEIYANQIAPLLAQIEHLCAEHDVPFLAACCLQFEEDEDGKKHMHIGGGVHLDVQTSPKAMLIAAAILQVPGAPALEFS